MTYTMRWAAPLLVLLAAGPAAAVEDGNTFTDKFLFTKPVHVCQSMEDYMEVTSNGGNAADLQCAYIDGEANDDILAPWVEIIDRQDGLVAVRFIVEDYRRLRPTGGRGGRAERTLYTGWTDPANLEPVTTW